MEHTQFMKTGIGLASVLICVALVACGTPAQPPTVTPQLPSSPTATAQPPLETPAPQPSPTLQPPTATPASPTRSITLEAPIGGALVSSPVEVRGRVSVSPFESTLRGRVYNAQGQVVGEGAIQVAAEMGQPGAFAGSIVFDSGAGGPGKVEVADISPKDGAVLASAVQTVVLAAGQPQPEGAIEVPAAGAQAMLPLHILARAGQPGQAVVAALRWQDGTELAKPFTTLRGEDGRGLLVTSLDWAAESQPPQPATQPATLEIRDEAGAVLARQAITILSAGDPNTQPVMVYWVLGENLQPMTVRVLKTPRIGTAALDELLWGPPPGNLAGFSTALPTPEQVLSFAGRGADWGPRVTLRGLTIVNGVATANFSKEMAAYGGGSLRVRLIREQITRTLQQFSTVREVRIAVEGRTEGVLEP